MSHQIKQILNRSAEVKALMVERCSEVAEDAAQMIATSLNAGGKFLLCGNGGSAGDAQHLAAEFVSCLDHKAHPRPGLAALAARDKNIKIISFTGEGGGDLAALSDVLIAVPSHITMHIQECHIAIGHAIIARVETLCS